MVYRRCERCTLCSPRWLRWLTFRSTLRFDKDNLTQRKKLNEMDLDNIVSIWGPWNRQSVGTFLGGENFVAQFANVTHIKNELGNHSSWQAAEVGIWGRGVSVWGECYEWPKETFSCPGIIRGHGHWLTCTSHSRSPRCQQHKVKQLVGRLWSWKRETCMSWFEACQDGATFVSIMTLKL